MTGSRLSHGENTSTRLSGSRMPALSSRGGAPVSPTGMRLHIWASRWDAKIQQRDVVGGHLAAAKFQNGELPPSILEKIGSHGKEDFYLILPAAAAYKQLADAYYKQFGEYPDLRSAYRDRIEQTDLMEERKDALKNGRKDMGRLAAPGKSKHGWGCAVDFNRYDRRLLSWLETKAGPHGETNAQRFGFVQSPFSNPFERWHFEYTGSVNSAALRAVASFPRQLR